MSTSADYPMLQVCICGPLNDSVKAQSKLHRFRKGYSHSSLVNIRACSLKEGCRLASLLRSNAQLWMSLVGCVWSSRIRESVTCLDHVCVLVVKKSMWTSAEQKVTFWMALSLAAMLHTRAVSAYGILCCCRFLRKGPVRCNKCLILACAARHSCPQSATQTKPPCVHSSRYFEWYKIMISFTELWLF